MREQHDIFHAASVDEEIEQAESHQPEFQQPIRRFPDNSVNDRAHIVHMLRAITQQEAHNTMNELETAWQRIVTSHQYETHIQHEQTEDTIKQAVPIWKDPSAVMEHGKTFSGRKTMPPMKHRSRRVLSILATVACIALVIGSMLWIEHRLRISKVAGNQHIGNATSTSLQPQLAYTYTQTGESYISSIRWSPTSNRLLSVGTTIRVWNFTQTFLSLNNPVNWPSVHTVWSPDGTSIAINNGTTGIEIRNATTGQLQRTCTAPTSPGSQGQPGADIQPQQQSLLSARVPYTSRIISSIGGGYFNLAWSPDGKYLAATFRAPGSGNAFVGIVVYATSDCSITWQPTTNGWYNQVQWSPDSQYLTLSDDSRQSVDIINFAHKQTIYTYNSSDVTATSWSPDDKRIAMYHSNGYVSVSDALTGAHSFTYKETTGTAYASPLAWSPDSKYVVSTTNTGVGTRARSATHIWNATTGQVIDTFASTSPATAVVWSPDGNYIAIGYSAAINQKDATIAVWHIPHW